MVLLKRSEYRAALEGFLEFRRSALVRLDEPALAAPLENLPQLYETWRTLEAILAFIEAAHAAGYHVDEQRLAHPSNDGIWIRILPDGFPAVVATQPDGRTAKVIPQRRYSPGTSGLHSVSFGKKPDIAIETTGSNGETTVTILDPKYKLDSESQTTTDPDDAGIKKGRPKRQDIDAMHAYRDAIRDHADARPVSYAATLYPGPTQEFGSQVAALHADPMHTHALQEDLATMITQALHKADDTTAAESTAP
ncbi:MAG: nuclease domain-containing protein [Solirubrobacteraceae bacterium]